MEQKNRIAINRCRKILGQDFVNFSDEQIDRIRIIAEMFADLVINSYLTSKSIKTREAYDKTRYNQNKEKKYEKGNNLPSDKRPTTEREYKS